MTFLNAAIGEIYQFATAWTAATTATYVGRSLTGCSVLQCWNADGYTEITSGSGTNNLVSLFTVRVTGALPTVSHSVTLVGTTQCDVVINKVPTALITFTPMAQRMLELERKLGIESCFNTAPLLVVKQQVGIRRVSQEDDKESDWSPSENGVIHVSDPHGYQTPASPDLSRSQTTLLESVKAALVGGPRAKSAK